ncbi:hypothetical protein CFC21_056934, partial [Triticum aestivum]
AGRW